VAAVAAAVIALLAVQVGHLDNQVSAAGRQPRLSAVVQAALRDHQARRVILRADAGTGAAEADLVVLPSGAAYMVNTGMPELSADRTYQLWGVEPGRTVSLGLLGNRPTDVALTVGRPAAITAYAVTVEQAGGVVSSTHVPVAEGVTASA